MFLSSEAVVAAVLVVLPVSGVLPVPPRAMYVFLAVVFAVAVAVTPLSAPVPNEETSDVLTPLAFFSLSRNLAARTKQKKKL